MKPSHLLLILIPFTTQAQPGDWLERLHNPCGFAPTDSIDLTNDGIPDLMVQGFSNGTDDVPSSSGSCTLHLTNLPGTTLLNALDPHQGYWLVKTCAPGERIAAMDTSIQDDLRIPRTKYADGSIQVAYWGYGGQTTLFTAMPGLTGQHFVFHTVSKDQQWHGSFSIEPPLRKDQITIHVGALVPADQSFLVR